MCGYELAFCMGAVAKLSGKRVARFTIGRPREGGVFGITTLARGFLESTGMCSIYEVVAH